MPHYTCRAKYFHYVVSEPHHHGTISYGVRPAPRHSELTCISTLRYTAATTRRQHLTEALKLSYPTATAPLHHLHTASPRLRITRQRDPFSALKSRPMPPSDHQCTVPT